MIVRNEAPIIERCLESVMKFIDHWVIVDTGSTDGTQQLIQQVLRNVPGELIEHAKTITVRIEANYNKTAGRVFNARTIKN